MRTLLHTLLVALLFPAAVFAQKDSTEVARLDQLNVTLYRVGSATYTLVWVNGKTTKSIRLFEENAFGYVRVVIESQQLDGKGNPELLISWESEYTHSYGVDNGGWSVSKEMLLVFNLNSWKTMFRADMLSAVHEEEITKINDSISNYNSKECFYGYSLDIDSTNAIVISDLKQHYKTIVNSVETDYRETCQLPDHQPGVYIIKNGIYVRKPD